MNMLVCSSDLLNRGTNIESMTAYNKAVDAVVTFEVSHKPQDVPTFRCDYFSVRNLKTAIEAEENGFMCVVYFTNYIAAKYVQDNDTLFSDYYNNDTKMYTVPAYMIEVEGYQTLWDILVRFKEAYTAEGRFSSELPICEFYSLRNNFERLAKLYGFEIDITQIIVWFEENCL